MTKKLVTQAVVPTNATKGSVCRIDVKAVTFADLWDAYVAGSPYRDARTGEVPVKTAASLDWIMALPLTGASK